MSPVENFFITNGTKHDRQNGLIRRSVILRMMLGHRYVWKTQTHQSQSYYMSSTV